jgi:bacterioferritin-associated ferredoxin
MIVCVCRSVNEAAIEAAVASGATTLDAIASATGAGSDCGCCHDAIEKLAAPESPCCATPCPGCPRLKAA